MTQNTYFTHSYLWNLVFWLNTVKIHRCFLMLCFACIYDFLLVAECLRDHCSDSHNMLCFTCIYGWLLVVTVEHLRDHCSDSHMLCSTCSLFIYVTFSCYSWTSTWSLFRQSYVVFHVYLCLTFSCYSWTSPRSLFRQSYVVFHL